MRTILPMAAALALGWTGRAAAQCQADVRAAWLQDESITYQLTNYPSHTLVTPGSIQAVIDRSFAKWASVLNTKFVPVSENPDITVGFHSRKGSTVLPAFDGSAWENLGSANTQGWGLVGAGAIGFDDDEVWTADISNAVENVAAIVASAVSKAVNLDAVATHEIGHTLGLQHTSNPQDIMYGGGVQVTALSANDRQRARHLVETSKDWGCTEAMTALNGQLYIIESGGLYQVDPTNGNWQVLLGQRNAVGAWTNTDAMTSLNGLLYVVENSRLYVVDPSNGNYRELPGLNPAAWKGTEAMTAWNGSLYIVENSRLYAVDPANGNYRELRGQNPAAWKGTDAMTAWNGSLYIVENSRLYVVDPANGNYRELPGQQSAAWPGTDAMVALGNTLFIVERGNLYAADPASGNYRGLTGQGAGAWPGTKGMAGLGGFLYIVQNRRLHRVNTSNGVWMTLPGTRR